MKRTLPLVVLALTVSACSSALVDIAPPPPAHYVTTHEGEGTACGVNLLGFIPIKVNSRIERAYQQALEKAGATGLMETQVTDRWYWIYVGDLFCTDVRGTGYRSAD